MKNEYKVTKELMMSWAREYHLQGTANIVSFLMLCIVGVMGLIRLFLHMMLDRDWIDWYITILLLVFATYKLFFARFVIWSNRYKLYSKTYGVSEWLRVTEFTDDAIILTDHNSISKFQYSNIKKIKEHNDAVTIFFNNNLALRLYKSTFVEGTWEECKEFLARKSMV